MWDNFDDCISLIPLNLPFNASVMFLIYNFVKIYKNQTISYTSFAYYLDQQQVVQQSRLEITPRKTHDVLS